MDRQALVSGYALRAAVEHFKDNAVLRAGAALGNARTKVLGEIGPEFSPRDGTVAAVIQRRNEAKKLLDACLRASEDDANKKGMFLDAAYSLVKGIEGLNAIIDAHASADAARREGPAGFVEVRSGEDWRRAFRDPVYDPLAIELGPDETLGLRDFFAAVAGLRSSDTAKRSLSVGTDSAGGYTVPTVLMPQILDALAPASSVLTAGGAIVIPADDAKQYRFAAVDALPAASWRTEGGNVDESDPAFRAVDVTPRSLAFHFKVSRELLMDASADLDRALRTAIASAFAAAIDLAALRGSGVAPQPRGILNTTGVQTIGNGANGASLAAIRWSNLLDATRLLLNSNAPMPTAAIMAPRTLTGFAALADTTNQPLRRPPLLEPMRFIATSQIPVNLSVGSSNDCTELYVGDFSNIRIVLREPPSVQVAREVFAATGHIGYICHARVDIAVLYPAAFAVVTGIRP